MRASGMSVGDAFATVKQLRLAPDPLAALGECTRQLLAAPHRGLASVLGAAEAQDARAAAVVFAALDEVGQLEPGGLGALELIELLDGLQARAHAAPAAEAVLIAEPLAIRARRFRRVIVTGLCEGEFPIPQATSFDPFLDDDRRRELALSTGLVLAQSADPLERERYLLYACVSRATERVSFSYRSSDEDGNVVIPSPFVDDIAELFSADWRGRRRRRLLADVVWSEEAAPTERERIVALAFAKAAAGSVSEIDGAPATRILSEQALSNVRHREIVSASALERFASCPVRWLVESQLAPKRLEPDQTPIRWCAGS